MPLTLITYDIACPKRLRRVAAQCEKFGERVQESVFLAELEPAELKSLMAGLAKIIRPALDSVHYTPVCEPDLRLSRGLGRCAGLARAPGCWVV